MGAVTYPSEDVREELEEHFVPLKIDEADPRPGGRELIVGHRLLWTPGLLFLDARGAELDRTVGFLPPADFLARCGLARGRAAYLRQRYAAAEDAFCEGNRRAPASETGPEALFWAGIARYKAEGSVKEVLDEQWEELRAAYPDSSWTRRADVFGYDDPDPATLL